MGLFGTSDTQQRAANLAEAYPPGTPFRLDSVAEVKMNGERLQAVIVASPVTEPAAQATYGVWGSLAQQASQAETGELPAIVTLDNSSGEWRFAPHGAEPAPGHDPESGEPVESVPQRVSPEAHMVPDAVSDAPNPAPDTPAPEPPPVPPGGHRTPAPGDQAPSVHPTGIDDGQTFQPGEGTPPEPSAN